MHLNFLVISLITFLIFFIEALIHYNIGRKSNGNHQHKYVQLWNGWSIHIPGGMEAVHIACIVMIFATVSGWISAYIIHHHLD